jgi:hypothetical protein
MTENYSGERRIRGTDLRARHLFAAGATYGQVIRNVAEQWGREGDTWNPLRTVHVDKVVATTARMPDGHCNAITWSVILELAARTAGLTHAPFADWQSVLEHARLGRPVFYWAPLDSAPRLVRVARVYKNGKVRLDPCSPDADQFTVDRDHLDRLFYRLV